MDASTAGGRLKPNLATTKGIEKPSFLLGLLIQILNVTQMLGLFHSVLF